MGRQADPINRVQVGMGMVTRSGQTSSRRHRRPARGGPEDAIGLCGRLLVRAADEARLVSAICRTLVKSGGYKLAWIGLRGSGLANDLRIAAATPSVGRVCDEDHAKAILRRRKPVVARTAKAIDALLPRTGQARKFGLRAAIACPLLHDGKLLGTLIIGAGSVSAFDGTCASALKNFAAALSDVLGRLETEADRMARAAVTGELERRPPMQQHHLALAQKVGAFGSSEFDLRTGRLVWSEQLYRSLDLEPGAVQPTTELLLSRVHPEDRDKLRALVVHNRTGHDVEPTEIRVLRDDGGVRWLRRISAFVRDKDGSARKLFTTFRDVTEERRIRGELELREARLREYQDYLVHAQHIAHLGSSKVDLVTGKAEWSDSIFALFGIDPKAAEAGPATVLSVTHPDDRETLRAVIVKNRAGEDVPPLEFRVVLPDGHIRWIRRIARVQRDPAGIAKSVIITSFDVTEGKNAETELRRSREHLARAQSIGRIGSAEFDFDSEVLVWSDETYRLFGLDPAITAPSALRFLRMVHADDRRRVRDVVRQNAAGEDVGVAEYRFVRADGAVRWHQRLAELLRDEKGQARRLIVTYQDVTEHKIREAELQRSGEHLTRVQQVAQIGSAEYNYRTGELIWSDEIYRLSGLDRSIKPSPEAFMSRLHPDDRAAMAAISKRSWSGADTEPFEFRLMAADGSIRWNVRHTQILRDPNGEPRTLIITNYDVTERKQMEDSLRLGRENLALAQKVGHVGSAVTDLITGRIDWSDEVYAIFGLDPARTIAGADAFRRLLHPDNRDEAAQRWSLIQEGNSAAAVEWRIIRPDGEERWVQIQTDIVTRAGGKATKLISTMQDITERKRAELQRDEFQRQLLQAQKMEAIGKLAGGVAHDFNNLLSVILGWLELVSAQLGDRPDLKNGVETSMRAARRGASLTHSMLAFSRQQPLKPVPIDVGAAIRDVIELLPRTLGESIEVRVQFEAGLWRCDADPAQLQNALLNLALNARDAMPEGGKLTIEAENAVLDADYAARNAEVAAGDYVALSVSDTGTGMPPEVAARAFDPFFTTKETGKGSGLGLSMVYGFARQSGGHVKIYSEVGQGTSVRIYLPRTAQAEELAEAEQAIPLGAARQATILIVEDDQDVRELTVAQLERMGYRPLAAADGPEGLKLLEAHPEVALLLTDLTLPGTMGGRVLADQALAKRPGLKILFMSGYTENAIMHHGRLDPGVHLLQKPFSVRDLAEQIQAALG